jgi:hypothetical protein
MADDNMLILIKVWVLRVKFYPQNTKTPKVYGEKMFFGLLV